MCVCLVAYDALVSTGNGDVFEMCIVSSCGLWDVCDARLGLKCADVRQVRRYKCSRGIGEKKEGETERYMGVWEGHSINTPWRGGRALAFMRYLRGIDCVSGEASGFVYEFKGEGDDIGMGK